MRHQTSLGMSTTAPMEEQFTLERAVKTISETGQLIRSEEDGGVVWGARVPNRSVWPNRAGFGRLEVGDSRIFVRGTVQSSGQVQYLDIEAGDVLVDQAGRRWEVLRREEWDQVGLLVLTVREAE